MNERIKYLLKQYIDRAATVAEERELAAWALAHENREALQLLLTDLWDQTPADANMDAEKARELFQKIIRKNRKAPILSWRNIAVAASVIALIGIGIYFYTTIHKKNTSSAVAKTMPGDIPAPASNRAVITLSDGSHVYLDSAGKGRLVKLGNIMVVKLANGQIAYQTADGQILNELKYNTLSNPKGSRVIDIQLSDGSRVWLNAGSSITYPVAFVGNEREVELKGEGYFEVAKSASKKFMVRANGATIEVLGTHFNVSAYEDETNTKVTLLEGRVKVSGVKGAQDPEVTLKPGQQAQVSHQRVTINYSPNLDQVMAWKNGLFNFENVALPEILKQLERWYDIRIVYEGELPDISLSGKITRGVSLKALIAALKRMGLACRIEERQLVIESK